LIEGSRAVRGNPREENGLFAEVGEPISNHQTLKSRFKKEKEVQGGKLKKPEGQLRTAEWTGRFLAGGKKGYATFD